jgi:hypothetical protein
VPFLIEPEWTKGHDFTVRYEVTGPGGGDWYIQVRDGERPLDVRQPVVGDDDGGDLRHRAPTFALPNARPPRRR